MISRNVCSQVDVGPTFLRCSIDINAASASSCVAYTGDKFRTDTDVLVEDRGAAVPGPSASVTASEAVADAPVEVFVGGVAEPAGEACACGLADERAGTAGGGSSGIVFKYACKSAGIVHVDCFVSLLT